MPVFTSLSLFRAALELSTVRYCFDDEGVEEARMETPAARVCRDYGKSSAVERYSVLKRRSEKLR